MQDFHNPQNHPIGSKQRAWACVYRAQVRSFGIAAIVAEQITGDKAPAEVTKHNSDLLVELRTRIPHCLRVRKPYRSEVGQKYRDLVAKTIVAMRKQGQFPYRPD